MLVAVVVEDRIVVVPGEVGTFVGGDEGHCPIFPQTTSLDPSPVLL